MTQTKCAHTNIIRGICHECCGIINFCNRCSVELGASADTWVPFAHKCDPPDEWLDDDGYPTEDALVRIETWPINDIAGCIAFMESLWWMADWGVSRDFSDAEKSVYFLDDDYEYVKFSTGGWSGNESLMSSFMGANYTCNDLLHNDYYRANGVMRRYRVVNKRRGGHYILEVPKGKE